jgi:ribosomal-protein-alanine N-acetyltransferase
MAFNPSIPLRIDTPRLVLRIPEVSDAPAYVAMFTNPLNMEHDPLKDGPDEITIEKYKEILAKDSDGYRKGEKALMAIYLKNEDGLDGAMIGMGGYPFLPSNADGKPGNTGVLIDSAFIRKGYASEALVATLDYGFDVLGFEDIEQCTQEANQPYRAFMQSMGLEHFGKRQEPDEKGIVHWDYTVNKAQWRTIKAQLKAP